MEKIFEEISNLCKTVMLWKDNYFDEFDWLNCLEKLFFCLFIVQLATECFIVGVGENRTFHYSLKINLCMLGLGRFSTGMFSIRSKILDLRRLDKLHWLKKQWPLKLFLYKRSTFILLFSVFTVVWLWCLSWCNTCINRRKKRPKTAEGLSMICWVLVSYLFLLCKQIKFYFSHSLASSLNHRFLPLPLVPALYLFC